MSETPTDLVLASRHNGAIVKNTLTREQVDLIKTTICKGATDDELKLFVTVCNRTGLDPFARQIHAIKRWDADTGKYVMAIQTGIDGLRVMAERSGKYRGQLAPEWCGKDGKWLDIWTSDDPPFAARVGVMREGYDHPIYAVVRFSAFCQTKKGGDLNSMWTRMGAEQIAKCAEGAALRKAFPNDMSGLYLPEEMAQADTDEKPLTPPKSKSAKPEHEVVEGEVIEQPPETEKPQAKKASEAGRKKFYTQAKANGNSDDEIKDFLKTSFKIESVRDITEDILEHCMQWASAPKEAVA